MANGGRLELVLVVATLAIVAIATVGVYRLRFHPLASIPGPKLAALSEEWLYRLSQGPNIEAQLKELHCKYDSNVVRIGPNEVHVIQPELYKVIYNQTAPFKKAWSFYRAFHRPHSLTTEMDPQAHRNRRRDLNRYFSKRAVDNLSSLVLEKISKLEIKLRRMNETFDMHNAIHCMTVDAISDYAFGSDSNMIEASKDSFDADFLDVIHSNLLVFPEMLFRPVLTACKLFLPAPLLAKIDENLAKFLKMNEWAQSCIDKYNALPSDERARTEHPVMFDSLQDISDEAKKFIAVEFLVAGSDTSALTITYAIYHILSNPKIKEELLRELEKALPTLETSPVLQDLEKLPFLTGCINEALRLACPAPGRLPRVVPDEKPLVVDGKAIAPGMIVGMSAFNLHFDQRIWGEDVLEFKPHRWLSREGERLDQWLVPFSKGTRACIGQNLALAEIRMTIAVLFRRWELELPPGAKLGRKIDRFVTLLDNPGLPMTCVAKLA
ncbi:hypothetical protein CGLO_12186 [Colletotrichum gloeosporioides Cg-14]|uniref:Cytochrome P450 n=1 Tax=Colletotrichum gloeosporioides (strain Cg-14) TaxID=1237896 RepID=T0K6G4_COLGC|nr:hypothetical protein CGLO_12186 [Colletotrichum gloeosporioides Cg-14]